jgi:hypothetical protein
MIPGHPRRSGLCAALLATTLGCGELQRSTSMDSGFTHEGGGGDSSVAVADASGDSRAEGAIPRDSGDTGLDGGIGSPDSAMSTRDARAGQIVCGSTLCNSNEEVCCVNPPAGFSCTAVNACPYDVFECSSASDCAPEVKCCGALAGPQTLWGSQCGGQACSNPYSVLCADDSECPTGYVCEPTGIPGLQYCKAP